MFYIGYIYENIDISEKEHNNFQIQKTLITS